LYFLIACTKKADTTFKCYIGLIIRWW